MRYGRILLIGLVMMVLVACGRGGEEEATPTAASMIATPTTIVITPFPATPTPDLAATGTAVVSTPPTDLAPVTPLPTAQATAGGGIAGTHTVQSGETLFCIGRAYGVLPLAIAESNAIFMDTVLAVGQQLLIPAVQWTDVSAGTTCVPQFQPPFAGLPPSTAVAAATATTAGVPPATVVPATATMSAPATAALPTALPTVAVADTRGVELVYISQPGMASRVVSPVRVAGEAEGAFEQSLVVNIVVNGQVIATANAQIAADMGQRGPFSVDVPFTLPAGASGETAAHILVYHISPRDGSAAHLSSTLVYLLPPGGTPNVTAGGVNKEFFAIESPAAMTTVAGGVVQVTGYSDPVFENNIGVVICGDGGSGTPHLLCGTADNVLGTGFATVQAPDVGQPGPFTGTVTYSVSAPRGGTIVLFVTSAMDGTVTHIYSRPVTLAP
jgi:LysM repeat protein